MPILLAATGFVLVLIAWGTYMATIPKGTVPVRPVGALVLQLLGVSFGIAGLVVGPQPVFVVAPLAGIAIAMGLFFPFLLTFRKTPVGDIRVSVGDRLLPFATADSAGADFHTDSLAGQRVLLKFFRGGW